MSVTRYKVEELECCFQADMVESPTGEYVEYADYARLQAEVERLRKAGDELSWAFAFAVSRDDGKESGLIKAWNAAKEGKQP